MATSVLAVSWGCNHGLYCPFPPGFYPAARGLDQKKWSELGKSSSKELSAWVLCSVCLSSAVTPMVMLTKCHQTAGTLTKITPLYPHNCPVRQTSLTNGDSEVQKVSQHHQVTRLEAGLTTGHAGSPHYSHARAPCA